MGYLRLVAFIVGVICQLSANDAEFIEAIKEHHPDKATQIHFYWSSGREPDTGNPLYGENSKIHIGGAELAPHFQRALEIFLEHSDPKISVVFVSDRLTRQTNPFLTKLTETYPQKLTLLDAQDVSARLKAKFEPIEPDCGVLFDIVFANAERGNPAIVSDFYRLVGMVYAQDLGGQSISQYSFRYSDVDLFARCLIAEAHTKDPYDVWDWEGGIWMARSYLRALFGPFAPSSQGFSIGRRECVSDLIKIDVEKEEAFEKFCCRVMYEFFLEREFIRYFPGVYDLVRSFEKDSSSAPLDSLVTFVSEKKIVAGSLFNKTGPGLCGLLGVGQSDLYYKIQYPHVSTLSWTGSYRLDTGQNNTIDFSYDRLVGMAFYCLKFGKSHPAATSLLLWLKDNNPYLKKAYRESLQKEYVDRLRKKQDVDRWLKDQWQNCLLDNPGEDDLHRLHFTDEPIGNEAKEFRGALLEKKFLGAEEIGSIWIGRHTSHFLKLRHYLFMLGIKFKFGIEDMDWRKDEAAAVAG